MANAYPLTTAQGTFFDVPRDAACTGRSLSIVWSVFLALCGVLPAGCHKGIYKPDTLPAEFSAAIADSTRQVDLARVARTSATSDLVYLGDVLEVMRKLAEEGRTMLMATHEMDFCREVSTQVLFLHEGCVEEQGPPEKVFNDPDSFRCRQFLSRFL